MWAEALRCHHCALVGVATLATDAEHSVAKIKRLPEGFKIVQAEGIDKVFCAACDQPARMLSLGSSH
jgi:predicted NAD/FAD-binding protein